MCARYAFSIIDTFFERYSITHPVLILDPRYNVSPVRRCRWSTGWVAIKSLRR